MKVLALFDGSDDGLDGLRTVASFLRGTEQRHDVTMVLVGWPPRRSPIWDRAFSQHAILDDLHRAMAEVAAEEFQRLRTVLEPLGSVSAEYLEGEPAAEIVAVIKRLQPDLVVAGLTRGVDAESVNATALEIVRRTSTSMLCAYGHSTRNQK